MHGVVTAVGWSQDRGVKAKLQQSNIHMNFFFRLTSNFSQRTNLNSKTLNNLLIKERKKVSS